MNNLLGKTIVNPVIKDEVIYIHTARETNGAKSEFQITLAPGGGTPRHYHTEYDETFEVIDGELMIEREKESVRLSQGESITVRRGEIHRFYSESNKEVKFRAVINPGHEGFENALAIGYGLAVDGKVNKKGIPKKLSHLIIAASMAGMSLPGIMGILISVLSRFTNARNIQRESEELIERYCK